MIHYNLSENQLETYAEDLLKKFDPERLYKTKPIDVYEVIEKCLGVPYDWKYITPNQSTLGLTAFNEGYITVLDHPLDDSEKNSIYANLISKGVTASELNTLKGLVPRKIYLKKGTILIDASLTEGSNRGRENFTVMHEVFHQVIHKNCFRRIKPDYVHQSTNVYDVYGKKKLITSLDIIEYQANACAAAFLMPKQLTIKTFRSLYPRDGKLNTSNYNSKTLIQKMANEFSVSEQAMKYRLINLGLAY